MEHRLANREGHECRTSRLAATGNALEASQLELRTLHARSISHSGANITQASLLISHARQGVIVLPVRALAKPAASNCK
jgi:hypothetical protein